MQKTIMPTPCMTANMPDKVHRRVFCLHYNDCLDFAVSKQWKGFSCKECRGYEREQMSPEQWSEDYIRCISLLYSFTYLDVRRIHLSTRPQKRNAA